MACDANTLAGCYPPPFPGCYPPPPLFHHCQDPALTRKRLRAARALKVGGRWEVAGALVPAPLSAASCCPCAALCALLSPAHVRLRSLRAVPVPAPCLHVQSIIYYTNVVAR